MTCDVRRCHYSSHRLPWSQLTNACFLLGLFVFRRFCLMRPERISPFSHRTLPLRTMASTQPGVATPLHARPYPSGRPSPPGQTLLFRETQRWRR